MWGSRVIVTGDASGGGIKAFSFVPEERRAAYVYTCYAVTPVQLTGTVAGGQVAKCRLLTNWPDIDPINVGVQGYSTWFAAALAGNSSLTAPLFGPGEYGLITANMRYILLFDFRPTAGNMNILELEYSDNNLNDTYAFEAYGYFWDRAVLDTPGGLRHPGST